MTPVHKLKIKTKENTTIQGTRCFFSCPGQINSWYCHSSFDFSVHHNDYNDYNDCKDYNDYNDSNLDLNLNWERLSELVT